MKMLHILMLAAAFCCILNFNVAHGEVIINGRKAKKNSLQYMVSVQLNNTHKCGGFLIDPSYVLTAAHCDKKGDFSVVIGTQNIDPNRNDLRRYAVKSKYMHPLYKVDPSDGFDIMLLKLSVKIELSKNVKIAKIPNKHQKVKPNTKCQVAGWGRTETKSMVTNLMMTDVSVINIALCKRQWAKEFQLPANVLCAGGYKNKNGACQGDSGGPLVCGGLAVGIVSFNKYSNCNYPNFPNVYTEISPYIAWINKVIKENDKGVV